MGMTKKQVAALIESPGNWVTLEETKNFKVVMFSDGAKKWVRYLTPAVNPLHSFRSEEVPVVWRQLGDYAYVYDFGKGARGEYVNKNTLIKEIWEAHRK